MATVPSDEEFLAYNQDVIKEFRAYHGAVSQLRANPSVTVELADRSFPARAVVTAGEERDRLYRMISGGASQHRTVGPGRPRPDDADLGALADHQRPRRGRG
jgi:hypothetical protein